MDKPTIGQGEQGGLFLNREWARMGANRDDAHGGTGLETDVSTGLLSPRLSDIHDLHEQDKRKFAPIRIHSRLSPTTLALFPADLLALF